MTKLEAINSMLNSIGEGIIDQNEFDVSINEYILIAKNTLKESENSLIMINYNFTNTLETFETSTLLLQELILLSAIRKYQQRVVGSEELFAYSEKDEDISKIRYIQWLITNDGTPSRYLDQIGIELQTYNLDTYDLFDSYKIVKGKYNYLIELYDAYNVKDLLTDTDVRYYESTIENLWQTLARKKFEEVDGTKYAQEVLDELLYIGIDADLNHPYVIAKSRYLERLDVSNRYKLEISNEELSLLKDSLDKQYIQMIGGEINKPTPTEFIDKVKGEILEFQIGQIDPLNPAYLHYLNIRGSYEFKQSIILNFGVTPYFQETDLAILRDKTTKALGQLMFEEVNKTTPPIQYINESKLKLLSKGWYFNRDDDWAFQPDLNGYIPVPQNVVFIKSTDINIFVRDSKLYNSDDKTFLFDNSVNCTVYWDVLDYRDTPKLAREIILADSKIRYMKHLEQTYFIGSGKNASVGNNLYQNYENSYQYLYVELEQYELTYGGYSMLSGDTRRPIDRDTNPEGS